MATTFFTAVIVELGFHLFQLPTFNSQLKLIQKFRQSNPTEMRELNDMCAL